MPREQSEPGDVRTGRLCSNIAKKCLDFSPFLKMASLCRYFQRTQGPHASSGHGAPTLLILIVSLYKKPSQEKIHVPFTSQKALEWKRGWIPERQMIGWRVSSEPQSQE